MNEKTIYYNGQIITMNDSTPFAQGIVVENGRIVAVGTTEEVLSFNDQHALVIDLQQHTLLPGFIDGHSHSTGALSMPKFASPPVGEIDTIPKLQEAINDYLLKNTLAPAEWFIASGYDNVHFPNGLHPTRDDLDAINKDIPMIICHVSGHVGVLNSKALDILEVNDDTPCPAGGTIQRDAQTNRITGVFEEEALFSIARSPKIVRKAFPSLVNDARKAQEYYASFGITTAQDGAVVMMKQGPILKQLQAQDDMLIDVCNYLMLENASSEDLTLINREEYDHQVKFSGVKLLLDGSPQAKTAWLSQPYYQVPEGYAPDYCGYPSYTDEKLKEQLKLAIINNWQVFMHCNGDAAIEQCINQYQAARAELPQYTNDIRPVINHAQTIREDQLLRVKELGMLISFFHDHTYYWGDYHLSSTLGKERGQRISPLKSALDLEIPFTLHQDSPIVPPNMLLTIHNAVNRQTREGQSIGKEFAIGVMDALKAITINGAYQHFDEQIKGSIEPSKYADFVILDKNPLTTSPEELKMIQVLETIKEGKTIYHHINNVY